MDLMKPGALSSRVSSMVSPSCWILGSMWVREQQRWADRREWSGVSREGDTSDSTMGSKEIARRLSFLSLSWVTGTSEVRMKARLELTRLAEVLEVRSSFNPSSPSDLTVWEKWPSLASTSLRPSLLLVVGPAWLGAPAWPGITIFATRNSVFVTFVPLGRCFPGAVRGFFSWVLFFSSLFLFLLTIVIHCLI